jgi:hypothetical protein
VVCANAHAECNANKGITQATRRNARHTIMQVKDMGLAGNDEGVCIEAIHMNPEN